MKYLLIILLGLLSCRTNDKGERIPTTAKIFRYEGCQYVRFGIGQHFWGGHFGTCDNPVHKLK